MEIIEGTMASDGGKAKTDADMAGKPFSECLKYNIMKAGGNIFGISSDNSPDVEDNGNAGEEDSR
jgi:hypothetical protein